MPISQADKLKFILASSRRSVNLGAAQKTAENKTKQKKKLPLRKHDDARPLACPNRPFPSCVHFKTNPLAKPLI